MQESIISALAALLGTVIGVCTTLVIHRIDRKINERKIINESIHYLLEVYLQINRVDAKKMNDEFWNYYWQSIRKYIHGDDKSFESAKEQLSPIINKNLVTNTQQAYKELEKHLKEKGIEYVEKKALYADSDLKISSDDLIKEGFIESLKVNDSECQGYVLIKKVRDHYEHNSFITCEKYTTKGYDQN